MHAPMHACMLVCISNCLYVTPGAVSEQLFGDQEYHDQVRLTATNWMEEGPEIFAQLFESRVGSQLSMLKDDSLFFFPGADCICVVYTLEL